MSTVPSVTSTTTPDQLAQTQLTTDTQSFLKLLTAQLTNQDPLQPVDSTQWVSQLAQFSSVEQAVAANSKIAEVLSELKSSSERLDLSYIGRKVEVEGGTVALKGGVVNASYTIPSGASSVKIYVLSNDGQIVQTMTGDVDAGTHSFTWDGTTSSGVKAPDGIYGLAVQATDRDGNSLDTLVTHSATVAKVRRSDGETLFEMDNGLIVDRDSIIAAG